MIVVFAIFGVGLFLLLMAIVFMGFDKEMSRAEREFLEKTRYRPPTPTEES